ncbi:MAG: prepilin-type N-terminal cleavage/methylation domain-containing protein [Deltaproteobacteria bacterium]|nr:prepilin-type N-terminal cleavage/methylation domain-containing protein [Deltaproteobacteria bacterium]MBW1861069.1 prepilin-type N-terminal cleavage/methylation domain-containing protein [Deltaproteobacteria bacterium]
MKTWTLPTGVSKANRLSGFTLIELLVVLFLVGLFSALLSVRIEGVVSGGDLRLATRLIIGTINELRGKAAYTHRDQELGFNLDENSFYPIESEPEDEDSFEWLSDKSDPELNARKFPDGVKVEDIVIFSKGKVQEGEAKIRFYTNGCIDKSLIHLRNEKDRVYTLEINPLTGHVRVYDRYVEQKIAE